MLEFTGNLVEDQRGLDTGYGLGPELDRPSRPIAGRSLGAAVTAIERPVRAAVEVICGAINVSPLAEDVLLGSASYAPGAQLERPNVRAAWMVVTVALIHARAVGSRRTRGFEEALLWFIRNKGDVRTIIACASRETWHAAEVELEALCVDGALWDLLPYVLEPHGHVTRARLEACHVSRATRAAKKSSGVFYTPSDVAEFVASAAIGPKGVEGTWLDPACGTGVFLRAVITIARSNATPGKFDQLRFVRTSLFGIDVSALSTDLTSFVLIADCALGQADSAPIDEWRAVRRNIVCGDALRVTPLGSGLQLQLADFDQVRLETLFGSAGRHGFDHVIMNPPYATVPFGADVANSWVSFRAKAASGVADAQTAFTEMLWKFTHASGSAAAVLPLSIGTNTSTAYRALRGELATVEATKDFLFFDREPQALFGEDIKTRNLILVLRRTPGGRPTTRTSRMLKWTGKQRPTIFRTDRLIPLGDLPTESFIPKLGSSTERDVYRHLSAITTERRQTTTGLTFARATLADLIDSPSKGTSLDVLISATAYNFLNVFFPDGLPLKSKYPLSSSPLNKISGPDAGVSRAVLAILCSRLSFWLWHVEGDGFHVTSEFLRRLPLWSLLVSKRTRARLADLGDAFWAAAATNRVDSVNGGRQTFSFHAGYSNSIYGELDELLLVEIGSPVKSPSFLDSFIDATVSVDGTRRDRGSPECKV